MSNEQKQTAVEWLKFRDRMTPGFLTDDDYKEAKEMEKERMIEFAFNALKIADDTMNGYVDVDKLYNETYGGNK
jgi:hypothetical protein